MKLTGCVTCILFYFVLEIVQRKHGDKLNSNLAWPKAKLKIPQKKTLESFSFLNFLCLKAGTVEVGGGCLEGGGTENFDLKYLKRKLWIAFLF